MYNAKWPLALVLLLSVMLIGCAPDLVVRDLEVTWGTENKKAKAELANIGNKDAENFLVYFDGEEDPPSPNHRPQVSHSIERLKKGDSIVLEADFSPLADPDNKNLGNVYNISVAADPKGMVREFKEKNNTQERGIFFDIHFVVLTNHKEAPTYSTGPSDDDGMKYIGEALFRREVEILNTYFVDKNTERVCDPDDCIVFRYKSHVFFDEVENIDSASALLSAIDPADPDNFHLEGGCDDPKRGCIRSLKYGEFMKAIQECDDTRLVDPLAVNFYIYDAYAWDEDQGEAVNTTTSFGDENGDPGGSRYRPFVMIDTERLLHKIQSPEEHEMGHAFGLRHNCDPAITSGQQSSNIMQSTCGNDDYRGGLRDQGFGIIYHEQRHANTEYDQIMNLIDMSRNIKLSWERLGERAANLKGVKYGRKKESDVEFDIDID